MILFILIIFSINLFRHSDHAAEKIKSGDDITFFVATDTHYLAKGLTDGGEAFQKFVNDGDGKELNYIQAIMDAFASDIRKKKPDVLIISGDLTSNGEKQSHLELAQRLKEIEKTGTSVYVIPGNHDILNPYARSFKGDKQYRAEYINEKDFSKIYESFGYKEAISRDKATLSYLAAPSEDVWLLMLDTAQYKNNIAQGTPQLDGRIPAETLEWIKQCSDLAKSKGAKLITVMHHNLLDHSSTLNKGFTINNSKEAIQVFEQAGINLTLSGHTHNQDIKSYEAGGNPIYDIVTACIGVYPQKYGILKYSPKDGLDYSTASVDVEGWAKETGQTDPNLVNFREHSRSFYGDRIYTKVVSRLAITDAYTSEELKLMGDVYRTLNLRYYEGQKQVGTGEIRKSQGFKLWMSADSDYGQRNVLRLIDADGEKNNKLHIPIKRP